MGSTLGLAGQFSCAVRAPMEYARMMYVACYLAPVPRKNRVAYEVFDGKRLLAAAFAGIAAHCGRLGRRD